MELLQHLTQLCGCDYLSDLNFRAHEGNYPLDLKASVRMLEASRWTSDEWKEAVFYITRNDLEQNSPEQYKNALLKLL